VALAGEGAVLRSSSGSTKLAAPAGCCSLHAESVSVNAGSSPIPWAPHREGCSGVDHRCRHQRLGAWLCRTISPASVAWRPRLRLVIFIAGFLSGLLTGLPAIEGWRSGTAAEILTQQPSVGQRTVPGGPCWPRSSESKVRWNGRSATSRDR